MRDAVLDVLQHCMVIHVHLGCVDLDADTPSSCPAAHALLPNTHQPKQNWADGGTPKIKVNPTQVLEQMNYPVVVGCRINRIERVNTHTQYRFYNGHFIIALFWEC